jgi:hypothetical protein
MSQSPLYPPAYASGAYAPPQPAPRQKGSGLAITSLVLGILAVVFSWIPILNVVGIVLGIIGLVFGVIGIFKSRRVMSMIGAGLSLLAIVLSIAISAAFAGAVDDAIDAASTPSAVTPGPADDSAPADNDPLSDGGFSASDIQVENGGFGTAITARVTNNENTSRSALFTLTIFDANKNRIGETQGSVNDLEAGQAATVTFIGTTDQLPGDPGTYTYELQTDGSY